MQIFYTIIFCYKTDNEGVFNVTEDLLGTMVLEKKHDIESVIESGVTDNIFDTLEIGTNVKFEMYNVKYNGVIDSLDDSLTERIKEEMISMIEEGELEVVGDFEFYATVKDNPDKHLL